MDYENILLFWINKISFQSRKELARRFAAAGEQIAAEEWACLLILWSKGPLSPGEIAASTVRDRTTATRLIDRLEKKKIVRRVRHGSDGRRFIVELTEKGQGLEKKLVPIAQGLIGEILGKVPAENLRIALETAKAISAHLDEITEGS